MNQFDTVINLSNSEEIYSSSISMLVNFILLIFAMIVSVPISLLMIYIFDKQVTPEIFFQFLSIIFILYFLSIFKYFYKRHRRQENELRKALKKFHGKEICFSQSELYLSPFLIIGSRNPLYKELKKNNEVEYKKIPLHMIKSIKRKSKQGSGWGSRYLELNLMNQTYLIDIISLEDKLQTFIQNLEERTDLSVEDFENQGKSKNRLYLILAIIIVFMIISFKK